MLKEGGRATWLEDQTQNLYGRDMVPSRQIVDMLASIGESRQPVEAVSTFEGADIEGLAYPEGDTEEMLAQTKHAITLCLAAGLARQDIAIASFRQREKSAILGRDTLGDAHTLKSFTGEYDLFGNPVFREGGA